MAVQRHQLDRRVFEFSRDGAWWMLRELGTSWVHHYPRKMAKREALQDARSYTKQQKGRLVVKKAGDDARQG